MSVCLEAIQYPVTITPPRVITQIFFISSSGHVIFMISFSVIAMRAFKHSLNSGSIYHDTLTEPSVGTVKN